MAGTQGLREELRRAIRGRARPGGNPEAQKYLGSPFPMHGLTSPEMKEIVREFGRVHRDLDATSVNRLVRALWNGKSLEEKWTAISILSRYPRTWSDASWRIVDRWVDDAVGWGLCDALASGPVADMVYREPGRFREVLQWTRSKNFWRRRISTYAMRAFVRAGELDKPLALLERLLYDPEFWVQRAVGTWLRECWKKNAKRTTAFLRNHALGLPPVTITVATERASKAFREELRRKAVGKRRSP